MDTEPFDSSPAENDDDLQVGTEYEAATKIEVYEAFENARKSEKGFQSNLLEYTLIKIRYYFYCDQIYDKTADDVLQIVIEKILCCTRKWYKQRVPDFKEFVMMVIHSYVRNERKKKDEFYTVDLYDEEGNLLETSLIDLLRASTREDLEDKIFSENLEESIERLESHLENDIYAYYVLEEMLNGFKTNKEIAERLNIDLNEVKNARRRIREKINKIFKKK